jgi:nucleoid DNA-binding protein
MQPTKEGLEMAKKAATATKKSMSKSEIMATLSEKTGLSKKDVANVVDSFSELITKNLKKSGPGMFTFPGMAKFKIVRKPATKARKGINPFTGQEQMFAAKPARNVVKILPLKALKDACK